MSLQDNIKALRNQGKTYTEIKRLLNCSTSTISYYLSPNGKSKVFARTNKLRNLNPIKRKIETFCSNYREQSPPKPQSLKDKQVLKIKIESFFRGKHDMYNKPTFSVDDVTQKFGDNPICYLTGRSVDLTKPRTYQFDHIMPRSRGGDNSLDNLGLACKEANQAKHNLTKDEFIQLCKNVLETHGYSVTQAEKSGLEPEPPR